MKKRTPVVVAVAGAVLVALVIAGLGMWRAQIERTLQGQVAETCRSIGASAQNGSHERWYPSCESPRDQSAAFGAYFRSHGWKVDGVGGTPGAAQQYSKRFGPWSYRGSVLVSETHSAMGVGRS